MTDLIIHRTENMGAWQAENRRLTREGWQLITITMVDRTVQHWAEKGDFRVRIDPPHSWDCE